MPRHQLKTLGGQQCPSTKGKTQGQACLTAQPGTLYPLGLCGTPSCHVFKAVKQRDGTWRFPLGSHDMERWWKSKAAKKISYENTSGRELSRKATVKRQVEGNEPTKRSKRSSQRRWRKTRRVYTVKSERRTYVKKEEVVSCVACFWEAK